MPTLAVEEQKLEAHLATLKERAAALANENSRPLTPITQEASLGLLEAIKAARIEAVEELRKLGTLLNEAIGTLRTFTTEASTPISPEDPFDQAGALDDLSALIAEIEGPLAEGTE